VLPGMQAGARLVSQPPAPGVGLLSMKLYYAEISALHLSWVTGPQINNTRVGGCGTTATD
jgi:hypothetical protein